MPLVDLKREEAIALEDRPVNKDRPCPCGKNWPLHPCDLKESAKAKLHAAVEEDRGNVRCECCEKWTPRETAIFGVEDGIYLCPTCISDLDPSPRRSLYENGKPVGSVPAGSEPGTKHSRPECLQRPGTWCRGIGQHKTQGVDGVCSGCPDADPRKESPSS